MPLRGELNSRCNRHDTTILRCQSSKYFTVRCAVRKCNESKFKRQKSLHLAKGILYKHPSMTQLAEKLGHVHFRL